MNSGLWMRRLGALILKEFRQIVRDPSSYLVAGVLPLLFLFIFGFGISLDPGILQLAVLNQSGGMQSRSLEAAFANSPWFQTHPVRNMDEAERLMRDSVVQGVLVLRQDMDAALQRGNAAEALLVVDGTEPNVATFIQSYGQGVVLRWQETFLPGGRPAEAALRLEPRIWYNPTARSVHFLVPGAVTVIMTLIGTLLTSLVFAREWERGTMEAMFATPVI